MKWRIKRKKIKKHHILDMWLRSMDDWHNALNNIEKKYGHDDPNKFDKMDSDLYGIGCDMLRYDWNQYLIEGEKIGYGYKDMNHYANEWDFK